MNTYNEIDSKAELDNIKRDFDKNGKLSENSILFLFNYIEALELALEYSSGIGSSQEENEGVPLTSIDLPKIFREE